MLSQSHNYKEIQCQQLFLQVDHLGQYLQIGILLPILLKLLVGVAGPPGPTVSHQARRQDTPAAEVAAAGITRLLIFQLLRVQLFPILLEVAEPAEPAPVPRDLLVTGMVEVQLHSAAILQVEVVVEQELVVVRAARVLLPMVAQAEMDLPETVLLTVAAAAAAPDILLVQVVPAEAG
jgi:hypothetical protein